MKVLLIVDVQNDFCPGGNLAVNEGDKIVPLINKLMESGNYDLIVATKDWHPVNHVSFAANHPDQDLFSTIKTTYGDQTLWPIHCVEGTEGAEFHPALDTKRIHKVIYKGCDSSVDSYSAFFDNAHVKSTGALEYIMQSCMKAGRNPEDIEIDVCGLALDYCVYYSAIDAADLGLKTRIIQDATRAVDPDNGLIVCKDLSEVRKVPVINSGLNLEVQISV